MTDDDHRLEAAFLRAFRDAPDKAGVLRLVGIPETIERADGPWFLVELCVDDHYQVGAVAPTFGTGALQYYPLADRMIDRRTSVRFVYVSRNGRLELTLAQVLGPHDGEKRQHGAASLPRIAS